MGLSLQSFLRKGAKFDTNAADLLICRKSKDDSFTLLASLAVLKREDRNLTILPRRQNQIASEPGRRPGKDFCNWTHHPNLQYPHEVMELYPNQSSHAGL